MGIVITYIIVSFLFVESLLKLVLFDKYLSKPVDTQDKAAWYILFWLVPGLGIGALVFTIFIGSYRGIIDFIKWFNSLPKK